MPADKRIPILGVVPNEQHPSINTEAETAIDQVVGGGEPQQVGSFRFWFSENRWEWSDELTVMFGYLPGTVEPSTKLLLSHKHPDDRERITSDLAKCVENAEPFCSRHRIIDRDGDERDVLVVGDSIIENDAVIGMSGYYVDVTDVLAEQRAVTLDQKLSQWLETGAVIEQAKGALMVIYGVTAEQAFRVLSWRSRETGCSVHDLAAQLVTEMVLLTDLTDSTTGLRTKFDHLLLTVHERATAS